MQRRQCVLGGFVSTTARSTVHVLRAYGVLRVVTARRFCQCVNTALVRSLVLVMFVFAPQEPCSAGQAACTDHVCVNSVCHMGSKSRLISSPVSRRFAGLAAAHPGSADTPAGSSSFPLCTALRPTSPLTGPWVTPTGIGPRIGTCLYDTHTHTHTHTHQGKHLCIDETAGPLRVCDDVCVCVCLCLCPLFLPCECSSRSLLSLLPFCISVSSSFGTACFCCSLLAILF